MMVFQVHASVRKQEKPDLRQFIDLPPSVFSEALKMGCTPFVFTYLNMKDEVHQRLVFGKEGMYFDYRFGKGSPEGAKGWADGEDAWVAKAGVKKLISKSELGRTEIKFIGGKLALDVAPGKIAAAKDSIGAGAAEARADSAHADAPPVKEAPAENDAFMKNSRRNFSAVEDRASTAMKKAAKPGRKKSARAILKSTPVKANESALDDASDRLMGMWRAQKSFDDAARKGKLQKNAGEFGFEGLFNRLRHDEGGQMLLEVVAKYSKEMDVPLESALAVICYESNAVNGLVSYAGAYGYAQVKPGTAKLMNVKFKSKRQLQMDADTNIRAGVSYLAHLYGKFGNWPEAYSAYNRGEHAQLDANSKYSRGVLSFERFLKEAKIERLLTMGTSEFMETPEYKSAFANLEAQQYTYLAAKK